MIIEILASRPVAAPIILSLLSVVGLVLCDYRGFLGGRFICKPLAAMAFIWLALIAGALESSYGQVLLLGLILAATGDILLMFESEAAFLAGLVAFLWSSAVCAGLPAAATQPACSEPFPGTRSDPGGRQPALAQGAPERPHALCSAGLHDCHRRHARLCRRHLGATRSTPYHHRGLGIRSF